MLASALTYSARGLTISVKIDDLLPASESNTSCSETGKDPMPQLSPLFAVGKDVVDVFDDIAGVEAKGLEKRSRVEDSEDEGLLTLVMSTPPFKKRRPEETSVELNPEEPWSPEPFHEHTAHAFSSHCDYTVEELYCRACCQTLVSVAWIFTEC